MTHPAPNAALFLFSSCEQSDAKLLQNSNILQWNTKKHNETQRIKKSGSHKLSITLNLLKIYMKSSIRWKKIFPMLFFYVF